MDKSPITDLVARVRVLLWVFLFHLLVSRLSNLSTGGNEWDSLHSPKHPAFGWDGLASQTTAMVEKTQPTENTGDH